jgi:hypothetical protein
VRASAQALADRAVIQRRHPDRRDEIASDEVGEHARVNAVGLACQRRDRLDLARVGEHADESPQAPWAQGVGVFDKKLEGRQSIKGNEFGGLLAEFASMAS